MTGKDYYVRLRVIDEAGNSYTSQASTFTYDTTLPTITLGYGNLVGLADGGCVIVAGAAVF